MLMSRGGRFDRMQDAWTEAGQTRQAWAKPLQVWSEELAGFRHAMTGERYSGCPTWYPARLADGRDVRAEYPRQDWPFLLSSFKSNLMSSISIGVDRLRQVHPHNPVSINRQDGERLGLRNGDKVRIVTPGGSVIGLALLRDGIQPGAVGIEHGYGHTELGARARGRRQGHAAQSGAGCRGEPERPGLRRSHARGACQRVDRLGVGRGGAAGFAGQDRARLDGSVGSSVSTGAARVGGACFRSHLVSWRRWPAPIRANSS